MLAVLECTVAWSIGGFHVDGPLHRRFNFRAGDSAKGGLQGRKMVLPSLPVALEFAPVFNASKIGSVPLTAVENGSSSTGTSSGISNSHTA
jgi:hypothetical protein